MKRLLLLGLGLALAACSAPTPAVPSASPSSDILAAAAPGQATPQAAQPVALTVGQTRTLTVYVNGRPAQPGELRWTTTNAAVATVTSGGAVSAVGAGSATVRAALAANPSAFLDFPVTVTAVASPAPAPAPTPAPSGDFERRVLALTNAARAVARTCGTQNYAAAPALAWNDLLANAARGHAQDMAAKNYFAHNSLDGRTPWDRIVAAGYTNYRTLAENIAAGQTTPENVVDGWLGSPGHCANIMNPALKELGVGYAAGGSYRYYWVQDFGAR